MSSSAPKTLISAELNQLDAVVERAKSAISAGSEHGSNLPTKQTFLEAFAAIQRREEDRRKSIKQEAKSKQQKKASNESNPQFRGTKIGVDQEVSAFWMVMEVLLLPELEACANVHDVCPALLPGIGEAATLEECTNHLCYLQDYCRPVQPCDLQLLLPQHESLAEDTSFFMPPLGFNPTQDEAPETDDGHDTSTPADPTLDPASVPTV